MIQTITWQNNSVILIDQRSLPLEERYVTCTDPADVMEAIRNLTIRGAPAIGVAAAMGIALGIKCLPAMPPSGLKTVFDHLCSDFAKTRPTARNLFWAVERMQHCFTKHLKGDQAGISSALIDEALLIAGEDVAANKAIGQYGKALLEDGDRVLTHCNAGALATAGYGTALGVIRAAWEAGKRLHIYVDETRPILQGARLTAWELMHEGIPATLIIDSTAGSLMRQGKIDKVIVGSDRIAANGDAANKIGTYSLAVLARFHGIHFYIAAPLSTFDSTIASGAEIPIEERSAEEITVYQTVRTAPEDIRVYNPAFDVTPGRLITAIITEAGIAYPPYEDSLSSLSERNQ
ncbi:MAG: S-methyl-5-thioribose-1-phosphate isomerase [Syntrophales bacterium]|jgi:methylthioribose-1-phosphate isomerase